MLAAIRKVLNVELSVNNIFIYPRISGFSEKFFQKEKDVPDDEAVPNLKHLVPVKTSGNKIPIYIIAGGGTALRFMKFAPMKRC